VVLTKPLDILQEIIDRDGDCEDFAGPAVCKRCPLGNKTVDGRRVNCMDFLRITEQMTSEQIEEIYKQAAQEELFRIELEEILK
jgi:hypothetical protein